MAGGGGEEDRASLAFGRVDGRDPLAIRTSEGRRHGHPMTGGVAQDVDFVGDVAPRSQPRTVDAKERRLLRVVQAIRIVRATRMQGAAPRYPVVVVHMRADPLRIDRTVQNLC